MSVRRWLPPLVWAGVILFGTSMPAELVPRQISTFDKVLHFTVYTVFATLLTRAGSDVFGRWRSVVFALVLSAAFAAADEWHQRFIPGRSSELADWRADLLGAALGSLAFAAWRRNRPEPVSAP